MTFEYTERYSSSLASTGHVDVSITYHLTGFCVAKSVGQWEHSSIAHELEIVANTLEDSLPVPSKFGKSPHKCRRR